MRIPEQVSRVAKSIFEAMLANSYFWYGLQFFRNPAETVVHSPIGQTLSPVDYVWNAFYIVGGASVFIGIVIHDWRAERAGLIVLAAGILANAIAVAALNPQLRIIGFLGSTVACGVWALRIPRR